MQSHYPDFLRDRCGISLPQLLENGIILTLHEQLLCNLITMIPYDGMANMQSQLP